MSYKIIHQKCLKLKDTTKALGASRFFKTGKGEYGEGDIFFGINVPDSKKIAKAHSDSEESEIEKLLHSKIHEERIIGLHILKLQYERAVKKEDLKNQKKLYQLFFALKSRVNNWDLVDSSAPYISGHFYFHHSHTHLKSLSKSKSLWDRRIAVVSMFYFIRQNELSFSLKVISLHLADKEDLMHKACGWMLREIGKRDKKVLVDYLEKYSSHMARTTLRYAIEKFSKSEREYFLNK